MNMKPDSPVAVRARVASIAPELERVTCRANARRSQTDLSRTSYQPVQSVRRALQLLRAVNRQRISTVTSLFEGTGIPKPTIVRMLEPMMVEGHVVRDNMVDGYRITAQVDDLHSGYSGISRVVEIARTLVIDQTRRIKWPVGLGVLDGDAVSIQFWTGAISPFAYTTTTLGQRADMETSAMGRAYLAFTSDEVREGWFARLR